jgi:dipeptidase
MLTAIFVAMTFMSPYACTNLLVTKGASADGSVMITYTCDGEFHPHMGYSPAADYPPGDSLKIEDWHGEVRGYINQVPHTYAVVDKNSRTNRGCWATGI